MRRHVDNNNLVTWTELIELGVNVAACQRCDPLYAHRIDLARLGQSYSLSSVLNARILCLFGAGLNVFWT